MTSSAYSRTTHTVRVYSPDKLWYADVEVLDAISFTLPNGFEICYKIAKPGISDPNITDNTGDGNGKPGSATSSRASHMQRVTSTTNSTAFLDVEVCDAFTLIGPNNAQFVIKCPTNPSDPASPSVPAVVDNTDSGLAVVASSQSTRAQHAAKLTRQLGGDPAQQVETDYTLTLLTDAIAFNGPEQSEGMPWQVQTDFGGPADVAEFFDFQSGIWYEQHVLKFPNLDTLVNGALSPSANTNDTTQYTTDSQTGQPAPPNNTDPNVYVYFPTPGGNVGAATNMQSPFLGATPYTASLGSLGDTRQIPAIDQGPIWWIRQIGSAIHYWYWFISPVQQPLCYSFFGSPPAGANPKWGYRGFTLLPDFPVSWILSENYPLVPLGTYGAPDLQTAASGYFTAAVGGGFSLPGQSGGGYDLTVNWAGVGLPGFTGNNPGVSSTINDSAAEAVSILGAGLAPQSYTLNSYYMPYGALDMLAPSSKEILASAEAAGDNTSIYTDYGGPSPNIWEVTGLTQPSLQDPSKVWNPVSNPHHSPTVQQAQECAQTFAAKWNAVSVAVNADAAASGGGSVSPWRPYPPVPGWAWATPYGGYSVATADGFNNWIVPGILAVETIPATVPAIAVDQLDPAVWNELPVYYTQQSNYGISAAGTPGPPVLYATGAP